MHIYNKDINACYNMHIYNKDIPICVAFEGQGKCN